MSFREYLNHPLSCWGGDPELFAAKVEEIAPLVVPAMDVALKVLKRNQPACFFVGYFYCAQCFMPFPPRVEFWEVSPSQRQIHSVQGFPLIGGLMAICDQCHDEMSRRSEEQRVLMKSSWVCLEVSDPRRAAGLFYGGSNDELVLLEPRNAQ